MATVEIWSCLVRVYRRVDSIDFTQSCAKTGNKKWKVSAYCEQHQYKSSHKKTSYSHTDSTLSSIQPTDAKDCLLDTYSNHMRWKCPNPSRKVQVGAPHALCSLPVGRLCLVRWIGIAQHSRHWPSKIIKDPKSESGAFFLLFLVSIGCVANFLLMPFWWVLDARFMDDGFFKFLEVLFCWCGTVFVDAVSLFLLGGCFFVFLMFLNFCWRVFDMLLPSSV